MKSELRHDCFWRRTDGSNHGCPAAQPRENVCRTRSGEGHDGIGTCFVAKATRSLRLHGIGIGAGGNVDGNNRNRSRIHLADCCCIEGTDRRMKTCAEDCIHDHVRSEDLGRIGRIKPARLAHDLGRNV